LSKDDNPGQGNPGKGFVTHAECFGQREFITGEIATIKKALVGEDLRGGIVKDVGDIKAFMKDNNGLSWQAKATILGSFIMGLSSIAVALIYVCG